MEGIPDSSRERVLTYHTILETRGEMIIEYDSKLVIVLHNSENRNSKVGKISILMRQSSYSVLDSENIPK